MNVSVAIFMVPMGIQEASCAIVGNCIGVNNVPLAKMFFFMISAFSLAIIFVICLIVATTRDSIISMFTSDPKVHNMSNDLVLFLSCYFIFNGAQGYL